MSLIPATQTHVVCLVYLFSYRFHVIFFYFHFYFWICFPRRVVLADVYEKYPV